MHKNIIKVLLIEDNLGDARLWREYLAESSSVQFDLTHVETLHTALQRLKKEHADVILLDLMLPDSQGLDTFLKVHGQASTIPIVVTSGLYDEATAVKAVHEGAQDYLVKGQVNSHTMARSLRYAIERHRMQSALRSQSLIDDLTGLYNRRGFLALAQQQWKLSRRTKRGFFIVGADLDGLKKVNDILGHLEGDQALVNTSSILKKSFRETDILARIGGDEFTVLAIDAAGENKTTITARLEDNLKEYNSQENNLYSLSLSYGIVFYDPKDGLSLEQILEKADEELYTQKRAKKGT